MRAMALLAVGCGLGLFGAAQASAALVAHYEFDNNLLDSSGGGHDGTAFGGTSFVAGKVGAGAIAFDGSTGYVTAPYAAELAFAGSSYTVAFWANLAEVKNQGPVSVFDNQADYNGGYTVALMGSSGETRSIHNFTAGDPYNFATPSVTVTGVWTHYALVYDMASGLRTMYVDGVAVGTASTASPLTDRGSGEVRIGALHNPDLGAFFHFHGLMDDVRLYNEALSASSVGELVNPTAVPEPATFGLAGIAALGLLRRSRRAVK